MDETTSSLLATQFSLVRDRAGAPTALLDALEATEWQPLSEDTQRRVVEQEGRALTAFERRVGAEFVTDIRYQEDSIASEFLWAEGTMAVDRASGSWMLYGWNEQPLMNIEWFQNGADLEVTHELIGTDVAALRTRTTRDETVVMQEGTASPAVGNWDWASDRGWVEIEGVRTCLVANAGRNLCQRVCEDGR
ncbi:MAG: hypothetical protein AAFU77_10275 [Myxococcota bacterium]